LKPAPIAADDHLVDDRGGDLADELKTMGCCD